MNNNFSNVKAVILGCSGHHLTEQEKDFFHKHNPFGFIIFTRNIDNPDQVKKLVQEMKATVSDRYVPILIDQEGGRVARLRPPHWRHPPAAEIFSKMNVQNQALAREALKINTQLMAQDVLILGINVICAPVLDLRFPGASDVIGDRSFGSDPETVALLGKVQAETLLNCGVMPIMKHIPGHGRALVDSHHHLPMVKENIEELKKYDFRPFKILQEVPWAMTGHLMFEALDQNEPVTTSKIIIQKIIREYIGFQGLLLSDDLSMKALSGSFEEKTKKSIEAGCDIILHCNGNMDEMKAIMNECPLLSEISSIRLQESLKKLAKNPVKFAEKLDQEFDNLMSLSS
ncbi:MAG: beta-N-acetylhexosaminidase [Alphaproteobacteria bacterium]|nr:beta-N-acetylhexosaminidase [Alphaproteobacteria bacterium]